MVIEVIAAASTVLGLLVVTVFVLKKPLEAYLARLTATTAEVTARTAEERARQVFREERSRLDERLRDKEQLLEEKMHSADHSIRANRDAIKDMVARISQELVQSQTKLEASERERIGEFNTLKTVVESHAKVTEGLKHSTDTLKNILSNNQLRGRYGEEVAENLLKTVGFVKGQNYILNTAQDTTSTRPDVTILLPDKTKINIDAKFPLQALIKFQETEEATEQQRHLRQFATDVKEKVKQVTSRDYINPEEGTVDFVILFVPNEMIFSFIYDQLHEVWSEALQKKVVLAGPFSFTAIIRMIYQSYRNFNYQENMHTIIKLVKSFEQEWEKYTDAVDTLGKRLESVNSQYRQVSVTRTNQLGRIIDKIKGENILPESGAEKLLE